MPFCRTDLFFDQIKVIEQPFPGRGNRPVRGDAFGQQPADFNKHRLIVGKPRQQSIRQTAGMQPMAFGKSPAMQLHLLAAEKLRAQRLFFGGGHFRKTFIEKISEGMKYIPSGSRGDELH